MHYISYFIVSKNVWVEFDYPSWLGKLGHTVSTCIIICTKLFVDLGLVWEAQPLIKPKSIIRVKNILSGLHVSDKLHDSSSAQNSMDQTFPHF